MLRALGYRPRRTRVSPAAWAAVEAGMEQARHLVQPLLVQAEAQLDCRGPDSVLRVPAFDLTWHSPALTAVLAGAERVTLFAGTAGEAIGAAVRIAFQQGEYTRAVILDACGTAAIQTLADRVQRAVAAAAAAADCRISAPYSPGYADWDLADAPPLLRALEARRIGLRVTAAGALVPEKSFCGVIGWLRGRAGEPQASGCALCYLPGCRYRLAPPAARPRLEASPRHAAGSRPPVAHGPRTSKGAKGA